MEMEMESAHAPETPETPKTPAGQFPRPIIIPPLQQPHQHTIILLHGRGSNARKFHRPLLDTALDGHQTFREAFPTARFVFPTAPMSRATKYARMLIHQWFDGAGDWEPEARGGMRPSIEYIQRLVGSEIGLLGGDARRVVLAGLSQGCATALTSLLLWDGQSLGAVVGLCGYVPACSHLIRAYDEGLEDEDEDEDDDVFEREEEGQAPRSPLTRVLQELREEAELDDVAASRHFGVSSTPVFLGHGTLDPKVDISQAFLADELLRRMGMSVELRTYEGLGHWYSREMLCHVMTFLRKHLASQSALGNLV